MNSFISVVPACAPVLWFRMIQHYLCELTFARMINFIQFRIACPALNGEHTNDSHWHSDAAALNNATEQNYDAQMTLRCADGYWLLPASKFGQPQTTQTVRCGLNGTWTPAANCSVISMHFCENCLTSFPVINITIRRSVLVHLIASTRFCLFLNIVLPIGGKFACKSYSVDDT